MFLKKRVVLGVVDLFACKQIINDQETKQTNDLHECLHMREANKTQTMICCYYCIPDVSIGRGKCL